MPARRRSTAPRTPKRQPGEVHDGRVYLPDHPLAVRGGWVLERRLAAFQARNGECICDAGLLSIDWAKAKVIQDDDGELLVLCQTHAALRWLAVHINSTGFGGGDGDQAVARMTPLWRADCPAGGPRVPGERQDSMEDPFGAPHDSGRPYTLTGGTT